MVVHPPFRWQRDYARGFREGVARLAGETDVRFAVENMFPLRVRGIEMSAYQPSWDVAAAEPYRDYTLDLSHAAVSHSDALIMLEQMGDRLAHLHVADGTGLPKDEHLVPGRAPSRAHLSSSSSPTGTSAVTSSSRSTPAERSTGPSGRPISPRRSRSAGCT